MKKHFISILCAGAITLGLTGCKSNNVTSATESGGAAAQNTPQAAITSTAQSPVTPENTSTLMENDIMLEIAEGIYITSDKQYITLNVTYFGNAENAEYCFGSNYTLKRWDDGLGDWKTVEFAPDSAFDAMGYLIGSDYPQNSIIVSLNDDFYAQPLEAGSYLVELEIDGITFSTTFDYKHLDSETGYVIDSTVGSITLQITEIQSDRFVCQLPWPYPAYYEVICNTSDYSDFCVNDNIEVAYAPMYRIDDALYRLIPTDIAMSSFELQAGVDYKPVIYLYPEEKTDISVKLDYNGTLTVTAPEYGDGWNVTASPDGTITADGKTYPYLFWEGERSFEYALSEGFCVSGEDTAAFLDDKLSYLGLSDSEKAEFCDFWLPYMEKNPYNIITFRGSDYTDNAVLDISPDPDTVIRVFMTFSPSDEYIEIAPQALTKAPDRNGFTVVEWGGAIIK